MTTLTITGALKAALATPLPTVAVYRDQAPPAAAGGAVGPCLVVQEAITATKAPLGDETDPSAPVAVEEEVQVDLYQQHHDPTTLAVTADPALADQVFAALDRAVLTDAPGHVYRFRVLTKARTPDVVANVERVTFRCRVNRDLP